MRQCKIFLRLVLLSGMLCSLSPGRAEVLINEILFNPPGSDAPNAYIELRGTPNLILSPGTYLVSVSGDTNDNAGLVRDVFDLSGRAIGGNGFLLLLQKTNRYSPAAGAAVLANTDSGLGFGDGSSSSIRHKGNTDLEHAPVTFFLIEATNSPSLNLDIDEDDDGVPEDSAIRGWTILDSVGVAPGAGDVAYGAINFRKSSAAIASGTVVTVGFSPSYVGRNGNSTGFAAAAWAAGDNLGGAAPNWTLGTAANTYPASMAGAPLNNLGAPNFGAPAIPGIVLSNTGPLDVVEGGAASGYTLALNTSPTGLVQVRITADSQTEISLNGTSFGLSQVLILSNTVPKTVQVRAVDDSAVEVSPHSSTISHAVAFSNDPWYPLNMIIPAVKADITDNDGLWLNEIKVNPPGEDGPYEFVEIRGTPFAYLTNVYFLAIEGNGDRDPGVVNLSINLSGANLGANGLLVIAATNAPYTFATATRFLANTTFSARSGTLENGAASFMLVASPSNIKEGHDLDSGNNGILEGLPDNSRILDAVGWEGGSTNDVAYGGVSLSRGAPIPDAAIRFPNNNITGSADAWFFGDLAGNAGDSLGFDSTTLSANFPVGATLTPGAPNLTNISISLPEAISGVIGDPTNPPLVFRVNSSVPPLSNLVVTATSSNPEVVPDANLIIPASPGATHTLTISPIGVGYATITISARGEGILAQATFSYAASAMGRVGGWFHTGASDASTAVAVGSGYMLVGDDEKEVLRLYPRRTSGRPLREFDMTPFLALPDVEAGVPREVDIEASTRVGNRIFWLGSHSHANIGEARTNRTRIFATDMSGSGATTTLTYAGRYHFLKLDLINWDASNVHGRGSNYYGLAASDLDGVPPKAPDGSGFSIEGLAMMPGSTNGAYVAFRAPIVPAASRDYALIVPVLNFAALAVSTGPPGSSIFGAPIELDLYGRGIRSIEGDTNGFLIVAGPAAVAPTKYPNDFRLYTWSGQAEDEAQMRACDLSGLNPEGIVELPAGPWTANSEVQLLSDNGITVFYDDGIPAKSLAEPAFKKFRSDVVTLGEVITPPPVITDFQLAGPNRIISWRGLRGRKYRVQGAVTLEKASWKDLTADTPSVQPRLRATLAAGAERFYRVVLAPSFASPLE